MKQLNIHTIKFDRILETKNSTRFNTSHIKYVGVIEKRLKDYGYTLSEKAANLLSNFSITELNEFSMLLNQHFKNIGLISSHDFSSYRSMFGNFPEDVYSMPQGMSEFLQFFQYFHGIDYVVEMDKNSLKFASETVQLRIIDTISIEEYRNKINTLLYSKTKISDADKTELIDSVNLKLLTDIKYHNIQQKEIFVLISYINRNVKFNDIVDVLRVAKYIGGVDGGEQLFPISKREPHNFQYHLTSEQKLYIVECINNLAKSEFDISNSIRKQLIFLFNQLGPVFGYKKYNKIVWKIRNTRNTRKDNYPTFKKIDTERSILEQNIKEHKLETAIQSLSGGYFIRMFNRLYKLILIENDLGLYNKLINELKYNLSRSSMNTRLQFLSYIKTRTQITARYIKLKHKKAKSAVSKQHTFTYETHFSNLVSELIFDSLKVDVSKKPSFQGKKIFIDERFKKTSLELDVSRISSNMKSYIKFFDIDANFDDINYIVPFVFVKSKLNNHETIDLSCVLFDGKLNTDTICWHRHSDKFGNIRHSGDSWSRTGDVAEYINIPLKQNWRYAIIGIQNYTKAVQVGKDGYISHGLSLLTNSHEERSFSPENTVHTFSGDDVSGCFYSYIIDLQEKRISLIGEEYTSNSVQNINAAIAKEYLMSYLDTTKKSWYDLMLIHVNYRNGVLVQTAEEADIRFDLEFASDSRNLISLL